MICGARHYAGMSFAFTAAATMALPSEGGTAFPKARIAAREVEGRSQSSGNPMIIAVSFTVRQRTVEPSKVHHVRGCDAVCVCDGPLTGRTQDPLVRVVVLFLMKPDGILIPRAAKASATDTRMIGVSRTW